RHRQGQTSLQVPSLLVSVSVGLADFPLASILSTSPSRLCCHKNHSLSCTAVQTGPDGCHGAPTGGSSSLSQAQRLFNVRRQFVDGVTAPVIKDLLNDLLADGVLNERERDSVLEERRARADQAECLIDMVRKKGNEASQKLIDHLKTRDSKLHPVLFPSADQEAAAAELQFPNLK
uniref:Caspase-1-A-like n=1 Tax=Myripristis murdjan TaxID=586833 RepID=A0A667Y502_9TELE